MQWLTAILAFATTMLIFAIIVSTIVETIHRALGSRTYGLKMMLDQFYDEILKKYLGEHPGEIISKEEFLSNMLQVQGPAAEKSVDLNKPARWQSLANLPVGAFMERLGSLGFAKALDADAFKGKKDEHLKNIAQKYVSYGDDAALYFERKARTFSVITAFFVAWAFYVNPEALIKTYLKSPEISAKIAEMSDDTKKSYDELITIKGKLTVINKDANSPSDAAKLQLILDEINKALKTGKASSKLLVDAGAPIGWPANSKSICLFGVNSTNAKKADCQRGILLFYTNTVKDTFWLLMGGLLIGLGAPFWAKAIGQIKQSQTALGSAASILKPAQMNAQTTKVVGLAATTTEDHVPITTEAFKVASVAT